MYRQLEKNLLSDNISSTCPCNMVNFGSLAAEIILIVWGTPANFNGFRVLEALLHDTLVVGISQTAASNRGRHLYSAGRPSRWALAHISNSCSLFLAYSQRSEIGCLPYFHTRTGLSANLECMSEMCCTWLTENMKFTHYAKNRHLRTIVQLCRAISSQLRHVLTFDNRGKKLVKQQYLLHMSSQYGELQPTNG